jgi:tol-pal system protein YbgF
MLWMPMASANAAETSVEQRLQRLERMTENPVLLQLSRRLGEQKREIQALHDDIDRLQRDFRNANSKADKRYKETDDRFSSLDPISMSDENHGTESLAIITPSVVEEVVKAAPVTKPQINMTEKAANQPLPESVDVTKSADAPQPKGAESKALVAPKVETVAVSPIKTRPPTEVEEASYQKAFSLMKASQYEAAIKTFQQFLVEYPNSYLASNSAYWAGEGLLIKKQNQAALDSFMIVLERYPESSKVADSQLRAGDSLAKLNNIEEAKKMYQSVINGRPNSRAAQKASKRLDGLK